MLTLLFIACTPAPTYITNVNNYYVEGDTGDTGEVDLYEAAPEPTVLPDDMSIDIFGTDGNVLYLSVDPTVVTQANENWMNETWGWGGYLYEIDENADVTLTNDLIVVDSTTCDSPDDLSTCSDIASYGYVEFHVAGQSTGVAWEEMTIPNLAIDMDEAQDGLKLGGVEYLRFNNGQVGSVYREAVTLAIFTALGYPAPDTSFNWLMSNMWPEGTKIPYTTVQPYKRDWCEANVDKLGGDCVNMWEGVGDLTTDMVGWISAECQVSECTNTRLTSAAQVISESLYQPNFKELTSDYIAWDMVHTQQCLDWMLWIGDDYYHNYNNLVVVERDNGKLLMLPYSTDISLGQEWYQGTELYGWSAIPMGCQYDSTCWADTITTCQATIDAFQALQPTLILDDVYMRLADNGMLRSGDEERYTTLWAWLDERSTEGVLEEELENYRADWAVNCDDTGMIVDTGLVYDTANPAPPPGGGWDTGGFNPCG